MGKEKRRGDNCLFHGGLVHSLWASDFLPSLSLYSSKRETDFKLSKSVKYIPDNHCFGGKKQERRIRNARGLILNILYILPNTFVTVISLWP